MTKKRSINMETAENQPRPCRWCGNVPKLVLDRINHELIYAVICEKCIGETGGTPWYSSKKEAIDAWNKEQEHEMIESNAKHDRELESDECCFEWSLADNGWADHTCSKCGFVENTDIHVVLDWNYCPNCGRKVVSK
jgi:hypothetical protein